MEIVIVTRHPALVQYLGTLGFRGPVLTHVTAEDVRGKVVVGVLPLHLAAEARLVGYLPLNLTPDQRGRELSLEEVRAAAGEVEWFGVTNATQGVKNPNHADALCGEHGPIDPWACAAQLGRFLGNK